MSKTFTTTAVILALLTGLVLGQFGSVIPRSGTSNSTVSDPSPKALERASAFYAGLNLLLATGDRSVETTVAPGFIDHTMSPPDDRTLQQMIDGWLTVGSTFPHLQVRVLAMEQRDRQIAVLLEVDPGPPSAELGISLAALPPYQALEFLRVEGAGVTERWETSGQLPVVSSGMELDVRWETRNLVTPAIRQVVLDPGRSTKLLTAGSVILMSESGYVLLDRAGADPDGTMLPVAEPLSAGQARVFAGYDSLTLTNESSVQAVLWAFSADSDHQESSDVTVTRPRFSAFVPLVLTSVERNTPQRLSILRVTLPPGATIAAPHSGIIEVVAVIDGDLEVTAVHGRALVCRDGNSAHPFDDTVTISAGEGVSANEAASLEYRVDGSQPVTFLLMRIEANSPQLPLIP